MDEDLQIVDFSSPDHGILKAKISSKNVYDKLGELSGTIEEGIRSVSSDARANIESDILKIKREASKSGCPEADYAILLFKKYAEEASTASTQLLSDNMIGPFIDIPPFLYEGTGEQLSGIESTSKNIFWMRSASAIFSFLCFVVMGTVKNISYTSLRPNKILLENCPYIISKGDFYYDSYKLIIAVSCFIFIHSIIFLAYYLLPVDLNGQKYIPGIIG